MKPSFFRILVKWFVFIIVVHIVAMLVFGIVISGMVAQMMRDAAELRGKLTMLGFSVATMLIAILINTKVDMSFVEFRRELKNSLKQEDFSLVGYYKEKYLKEHIWKIGIIMIFQIPFALFYNAFGFVFENTTGFEQFYVLDSGAYVFTGSAILGFLLNFVVFGIVFLTAWWAVLLWTKKSLETELT